MERIKMKKEGCFIQNTPLFFFFYHLDPIKSQTDITDIFCAIN